MSPLPSSWVEERLSAEPRKRGSSRLFQARGRAAAVQRLFPLALTLLALSLPVAAADGDAVATALQRSADIDRLLHDPQQGMSALQSADPQLQALSQQAQDCIETRGAVADKLSKNLLLLGKAAPGDDVTVTRARRDMQEQQQRNGQELASCRLLLVQTNALQDALQQRLDQARARHLLERGPALPALLPALGELQQLFGDLWAHWRPTLLGLDALGGTGYAILAALLAVALGAGVHLRLRLKARAAAPSAEGFGPGLVRALSAAGARYSPALLTALAWSAFWWSDFWLGAETSALAGLGTILAGWLLLALLSRGLFAPPPPAEPFLSADPTQTRRLDRTLRFTAWLAAAGVLPHFLVQGVAVTPELESLAQLLLLSLLSIAALRIAWLTLELVRWPGRRALRLLLAALLVAAVTAEWVGYHSLGPFLLRALLFSTLVLLAAWLLMRLASGFFDGLDAGRQPWQRALQGRMGAAEEQEPLPGSLWLRLVVGLAIWIGAGLLLMLAWEVPASVLQLLSGWLTSGVRIGGLQLEPARILMALAVLGLLLSAAAVVKQRMESGWLRRTVLEEGARNAFATLLGYGGTALAVLSALAVAGLDLSNLALIAGALSVGIGFGLQNVINNFVSGLILLFERPIRRGDWIQVGGTEGRVHRISIRSTRIRTFDRADVVVPNSELIAGQVTNWTLRDPVGRVRVPVGVAYGSDLQRVREILLEIASAQPLVQTDPSVPPPVVLFLGFGDSSLNLELRFFVRDVNKRIAVLSEVNFAIDAAFREANIEIPFPQRDLHLRDGLVLAADRSEIPPASPSPATPRSARRRDSRQTGATAPRPPRYPPGRR